MLSDRLFALILLLLSISSVVVSFSIPSPNDNPNNIRLYLETANAQELKTLLPTGAFHGIAIHPILLREAGVACTVEECKRVAEVAFSAGAKEVMVGAWPQRRVPGIIGSTSTTTDDLVALGLALRAAIDPEHKNRIVLMVPATLAGTAAASRLLQDDSNNGGMKVCLSSCYDRSQALVASAIHADFAMADVGGMFDAGLDAQEEMEAMVSAVLRNTSSTRIVAADIRRTALLSRLSTAGVADFCIPPSVALELFGNPLTERAANAQFEAAVASDADATLHASTLDTVADDGDDGGKAPETTADLVPVVPRDGVSVPISMSVAVEEALTVEASTTAPNNGDDKPADLTVTPLEALTYLDHPNVHVIEIREAPLLTSGIRTIMGAEWLPASRIGKSGCPLTLWPERPKGPVLLVCEDGVDSLAVMESEAIAKMRNTRRGDCVYAVEGGVEAWVEAKLPTMDTKEGGLPLAFQ